MRNAGFSAPERAAIPIASLQAAIASVAAHIAPAVAEARAAPAAAIASVAAHTVAAIAGDSDEGVDRLRAPQFPLHPNRIEGETGCGPGFSPPQPPAIPIAPLHREIFRAQTYANV